MRTCRILILINLILFTGLLQLYAQKQKPPASEFLSNPVLPDPESVTYYVSNSGDDNNSGLDSLQPFRTYSRLNHAGFSHGGTTILFKGGDTITSGGSSLVLNKYFDNKESPVVFNSYGNGKAVLLMDSSNLHIINVVIGIRVRVVFKNIVFKGVYNPLKFSGGNLSGGLDDAGLKICSYPKPDYKSADSMLILINNCVFENLKVGLQIRAGFNRRGRYIIDSNYIHNIGTSGMSVDHIQYSDLRIYGNEVTDIEGKDSTSSCSATGISLAFTKNALIERNYINRVGYNHANGTGGIYFANTRNSTVRHNEIRNVRNDNNEGTGIYPDAGSDSNVIEFNYIANCRKGICVANAPTSYNGYWNGIYEDSLQASFNVVRFNVVIGDSGTTTGLSMNSFYKGYIGIPNKKCFVYNNLVYLKRTKNYKRGAGYFYNDSLNLYSCFNQFGYADRIYLYNNIFITGDSVRAISHSYTRTHPTNGFWSDWFTNTRVHNNLYYPLTGKTNRMFTEFSLSDTVPFFYFKSRTYSSIKNWADSTGLEMIEDNYTFINADPLIKRLTQNLSAKINPYFLDTLTCFQFKDGSPAEGNGINYNSRVKNVNDTLKADWYGTPVLFLKPDIGIYTKPQ